MSRKPYRDGRIHVLSTKCSTCVFRPGNLMHLKPGRLGDLVEGNRARDTAFACHQTLYVKGQDEAICRGYDDAYWQQVTSLRLATLMDLVTWASPTPKEDP